MEALLFGFTFEWMQKQLYIPSFSLKHSKTSVHLFWSRRYRLSVLMQECSYICAYFDARNKMSSVVHKLLSDLN